MNKQIDKQADVALDFDKPQPKDDGDDEIDFTDLPVGDPGVLGRLFVAESLEPGAARQLMVSGG